MIRRRDKADGNATGNGNSENPSNGTVRGLNRFLKHRTENDNIYRNMFSHGEGFFFFVKII